MRILKTFEEVRPFLSSISSLADANKSPLGFLPRSAYRDQAVRGRLWIAVRKDSDELLGYLLFGGRFPSIKIFQIFVSQENRRLGIASKLVKQLADYGEANNYLTISARVAADLAANKFWENVGFHLVRQESSGKSGRIINIRVKDLDTPSLFKIMDFDRTLPATRIQDLHFVHGPISKSHTYVLDLNVFFDVVRDRVHRKEAALLIKAGLNHQIHVCVTPEFSNELRKHTKAGRPDPILEFAEEIPALPSIEQAELDRMLPELQAIIFPHVSPSDKCADKVSSDLVHLAYCIHHRATGFVTREKAILAAGEHLRQHYFLETLSPADLFQAAEFSESTPSTIRASYGQQSVRVDCAHEGERGEVERFLVSLGVDSNTLPAIWNPGVTGSLRRRITIRVADKLVGVASWDKASRFKRNVALFLYVDEQTPEAERVIDHVLETVLRDSKPFESRKLLLETTREQTQTRATALQRGFVPTNREAKAALSKFTFRGSITKQNWRSFSDDFRKLTGLRLPDEIPKFNEFQNTGVAIQNEANEPISVLKLFDFETLVSPALVLCPKRVGLIVPIRAYYAKDLFEIEVRDQIDLFPASEAVLHVEKAYFRLPRRVNLFHTGVPVLFYLSGSGGGTKEVIGSGRITYSEILPVDKIRLALRRQGVLSREELQQISDSAHKVHTFTFDNFNLFPNKIPYRYLRDNGLISKANLVTAEPLSAEHLTLLCRCGFGLEEIK